MGRACHDQPLLFASILFWRKHSCTKGLVPLDLITFLSRTSSRQTSRNESQFMLMESHLFSFTGSFLPLVFSLITLWHQTKVWCMQREFQASEKDWKESLKKTSGQRLCSLPKKSRKWVTASSAHICPCRHTSCGQAPRKAPWKKGWNVSENILSGLVPSWKIGRTVEWKNRGP